MGVRLCTVQEPGTRWVPRAAPSALDASCAWLPPDAPTPRTPVKNGTAMSRSLSAVVQPRVLRARTRLSQAALRS